MKKNIDVMYKYDEVVTLREFIKKFDINENDNVIIEDYYLREFKLKDFNDMDAVVDEAYLEEGCLTIGLRE